MPKNTDLNRSETINYLKLLREKHRRKAGSSLIDFTTYTKDDYSVNWHHAIVSHYLDLFAEGHVKKMMLTMPPQHGKSELASRRLPAYMLGKDPTKKIAGVSYNATFASKFNRDIQRIIDSKEYGEIFPETRLNSKNVATDSHNNWLRNSTEFEVIEKGGGYLSVGTGGALTGNKVDVGIIDDPYKDAMQAWSANYRQRVWEWYTTTFLTRLHNESQQLIIMTRWHEQDLIGQLLANEKDDTPEDEKWVIINLPAILENETDRLAGDDRDIGEALWEKRHSLRSLLAKRSIDDAVFNCMYQGKPAPEEGALIKSTWFDEFTFSQLVEHSLQENEKIIPMFYVDGAETDNEKNDPSVILCGCRIGNIGYILDIAREWKEFYEWIDWFKMVISRNDYDAGESWIKIEPKSMGKSAVSQVRNTTMLNIDEFAAPKESKTERARACVPIWKGKRVKILAGASWATKFFYEIKYFPNGGHDDQVDTLVMFTMDLFPVDEIWANLQGSTF